MKSGKNSSGEAECLESHRQAFLETSRRTGLRNLYRLSASWMLAAIAAKMLARFREVSQ